MLKMLILLVLITGSALAQKVDRAWAADYLRYYQIEARATAADLDRIVELKLKIDARATTLADRQAAFKELYGIFYRLLGTNPIPSEAGVTAAAQFFGQSAHNLVAGGEVRPVASATTPLGELGRVEKAGRGPVPMILIADVGADGKIYREFVERNAARYTMFVVTLAGFGGTPAPPRTGKYEPGATPWLDGAQQGILKLIEKERLSKPVVVGMQGSASIAARLALEHPDKVRSAVVLDGLVSTPFRGLSSPDLPATAEERRVLLTTRPGPMGMMQELFPQVIPSAEAIEQTLKAMPALQRQGAIGINTRNPERGRALYLDAMLGADPRTYRYSAELLGLDLSKSFARLSTPVLAIPSIHDDASPGQGSPGLTIWRELKLRHPGIPLRVVPFENVRNYATEEAPADLDRAIEAFLAGKPFEVDRARGPIAARPSPRAALSQAVGAVEVWVSYGRPQVNGREIWGRLVPENRVWRAGANEATRISFGGDVLVEGQPLAAGAYALFMIPAGDEWTIIFNRIADQWGAFSYNPEFDALRVKVKAQAAAHEEWLSYRADVLSAASAQINLHWEKKRVAFKVEAAPPKTTAGGQ